MSQLHRRTVFKTEGLPKLQANEGPIIIDDHHVYGYACLCSHDARGCCCTMCGKRFGKQKVNMICQRYGYTEKKRKLVCFDCFEEHAVLCALEG